MGDKASSAAYYREALDVAAGLETPATTLATLLQIAEFLIEKRSSQAAEILTFIDKRRDGLNHTDALDTALKAIRAELDANLFDVAQLLGEKSTPEQIIAKALIALQR